MKCFRPAYYFGHHIPTNRTENDFKAGCNSSGNLSENKQMEIDLESFHQVNLKSTKLAHIIVLMSMSMGTYIHKESCTKCTSF